ncbi:MAG: hypothetical protein H0X34_11110 [Chthoniobacterales bacterium]|nr:hypothetical protein [Chthoniobacterales bacterium]
MKVAKKSSKQSRQVSSPRATLALARETYKKIDQLRGEHSRSAWIQCLIEREEERCARERFAQKLRKQYPADVCRETLALNKEFSKIPGSTGCQPAAAGSLRRCIWILGIELAVK